MDDSKSYYQLIMNIKLSEDFRKDENLVNSQNYPFYDSGKNFGYWDFVVIAMVILLKFVTGWFKMQI